MVGKPSAWLPYPDQDRSGQKEQFTAPYLLTPTATSTAPGVTPYLMNTVETVSMIPFTVAIPSWLPMDVRGILSDLNTGAITTRVPLQARAHLHQHAPMQASNATAFYAESVIIFDGNWEQHQLHPFWPPQPAPLMLKWQANHPPSLFDHL